MREAPRLALLLAVCSLIFPAAAGSAFPGANGRIVFVTDRDGQGNREIYTSNADGSDPQRLTTNIVADTEPAYSPDGTKIAFTRSNDIWVMNADGSGQVAITGTGGARQRAGVVAGRDPDRLREQPEQSQRRHDGTGAVREERGRLWNRAPGDGHAEQRRQPRARVVPAGDQIAYESNADGDFEIYTIDAPPPASFGTRRSANEVGPELPEPELVARTATRIAFERGIGTNVGDTTKEIWTMRADGSDRVQLTNNGVYDVQPAYSPDGTQIATRATRTGTARYTRGRPTAGGRVRERDQHRLRP